jgi:ArsR family transcriptional regulator
MHELFKALSEKSRLRILSLLKDDELCVCEIEACLDLTQSNISRHLTVLKNCGILDSYKTAQWVYYKVNDSFKQDNSELWDYLLRKFTKLQEYQTDYQKCKIYKNKNLCNKNN